MTHPGIPTLHLFFKDCSCYFQVYTWLQLNKFNLKFHFFMFLGKCDFWKYMDILYTWDIKNI